VVDRKLNSIGLPDGEGNPEDREALKKALEDEGISFHGNASTDKLVTLYMSHFYPETEEEEEEEEG
jgi:pyridoxine/pyridoxamine 5'-phosphate oxidase